MSETLLRGRARYYVNDQETDREHYESSLRAGLEAGRIARKEKEFVAAEDAFAYAATLEDGIVLDWGRCYAAMEREGLKIGFVCGPHDQPIVTPEDLLARPGPCFILARRDVRTGWMGSCSTDFVDSSKSWSEDEVEVIEDGTERYRKGQHLFVRVYGSMGARAHVGRNWRMVLLKPEDVLYTVAPSSDGERE